MSSTPASPCTWRSSPELRNPRTARCSPPARSRARACRTARAPRCERPLRQLHALGLLRPGFSAIGAGSCDGADLELLARHGAGLIACPQAELRLGARSPVAALEGNRTGLGTDSPVAAGALDLLAEARAAALHSGLTAGEVLRMAT